MRTDTPLGYLRCDGNEWPASAYDDFVKGQLITGKIKYITLEQYQEQLNINHNNCGFFGYDETKNILRVPQLDDRVAIMQALALGDIGKYNQDQIVNITSPVDMDGNLVSSGDRLGYYGSNLPIIDTSKSTALSFEAIANSNIPTSGSNGNASHNLMLDASRQVNTGDRVQPRHIQFPLFVCVSNISQPITEENVNLFLEGMNNKVNKDFSNLDISDLDEDAKDYLSSLSMPSSDYIDLTLGVSGTTYTMPANGYLCLAKHCNGTNQYTGLHNLTCEGIGITLLASGTGTLVSNIPVSKGDIGVADYSASGPTEYFRFVYAKGAKRPSGG
jgi:hypothetical protein